MRTLVREIWGNLPDSFCRFLQREGVSGIYLAFVLSLGNLSVRVNLSLYPFVRVHMCITLFLIKNRYKMLFIQQFGTLKPNKMACIHITANDKQEHMLNFMPILLGSAGPLIHLVL